PRRAEIARVIQRVLVDRLLRLSADGGSAPWVRSRVDATLADLLQVLDEEVAEELDGRAHSAALAAEIGRHLARPAESRTLAPAALPEPPGPPIGAGFLPDLAGCDFEPPLG
ncbi:MAG TPA: hypothetical protein VLA66_13840, partial [Thermoanaerobaculia bacterium]|nr:hypothetical protein [Thermoanaerobaculia bacterium]